jgi:hypothetical protein
VVLLVHGTNAAQEADEGESWWQRESDFHRWFVAQMGTRLDCQPSGGVFHWTGENTEWARQEAGRALAGSIRAMEEEQRPYHLVGHSHGGSVIWNALRDVATEKNPLPNLRSWTTIGTPFLHYRARAANLYLLLPVFTACYMLLPLLGHLRTWWAMLPTLWSHPATRTGSIALPALCAVLVAVALAGIFHFVSRFLGARRERARHAAWNEAYRVLGERHLAIWSPDDEAANGLRGTLAMGGEIIPRPRFGSGWMQRLLAWSLRTYIGWYERFFARPGDEFILDRVSRKLQGNDTGDLELVGVGAAPIAGLVPQAPLPDPVCRELREYANRYAAAAVAGVRNAMGLLATSGAHLPQLVTGFTAQLTGRELVHTAYYDAAPVRDLIRRHIHAAESGDLPGPRDELGHWLATRRDAAGTRATDVPRAAEYKNLARVTALALTGAAVAAALASRSVFDTTIRPLTAEYQAEQALAAAPLRDAVASAGSFLDVEADTREWFDVLVRSHRVDEAVRSAYEVDTSNEARLATLATLSHTLLHHRAARAAEVLDSALALTRRHPGIDGMGPGLLYRELAHAGRAEEIRALSAPVFSLGPPVTALVIRENLALGSMHAGRPAAAQAWVREIGDAEKQIELADSIARMLSPRRQGAELGRIVAWMDTLNARQASYDSKRGFRKRIAFHFARLGQMDSARARLSEMQPRERVNALAEVALLMDSTGRSGEARALALALADSIRRGSRGISVYSDEGSWQWAAATVGIALTEMEIPRPAREILAAADSPAEHKDGTRNEQAHASLGWARLGDSPRALAPVAWDTTSNLDERYLKELAHGLVRSGRATESLPWIERIPSPARRLRLLSWIAPALGPAAERTLVRADSLSDRIGGELARSRVSAHVAIAWARTGQLHRARAMTGRCLALDRLRIYTAILAEHWDDPGRAARQKGAT